MDIENPWAQYSSDYAPPLGAIERKQEPAEPEPEAEPEVTEDSEETTETEELEETTDSEETAEAEEETEEPEKKKGFFSRLFGKKKK